MNTIVQAHIIFSGTVQGVGFRYTTLNYAKDLALTGWVKNLPNGSVEALVQGNQKDIDRLCQRLKDHFGGYIANMTLEQTEIKSSFKDFDIHH